MNYRLCINRCVTCPSVWRRCWSDTNWPITQTDPWLNAPCATRSSRGTTTSKSTWRMYTERQRDRKSLTAKYLSYVTVMPKSVQHTHLSILSYLSCREVTSYCLSIKSVSSSAWTCAIVQKIMMLVISIYTFVLFCMLVSIRFNFKLRDQISCQQCFYVCLLFCIYVHDSIFIMIYLQYYFGIHKVFVLSSDYHLAV